MRRHLTSRRVALALGLATLPFLVGCGSNNSAPAISATAAMCASNPAYPGCAGLTGGCVPPTTPIAFTATGMYMGSANLLGGTIPLGSGDPAAGQTYGQVVVAAGGSMIAPTSTGLTFTRTAVDATIMLNINSVTYGTTPAVPSYTYGASGMGTTTGTGALQISQGSLGELYAVAQSLGLGGYSPYGTTGTGTYPYGTTYGSGYPTSLYPGYGTTQSQVCISGIGFDTGYSGTTLINGEFYLFLNNTQHGWSFPL